MNDSWWRRDFLSLSLFSGGALALEITLTRVLATLYFPPLIFAVLSLAVLGIGIGAALASYFPALRTPSTVPLWMSLAGISTLVITPLILYLATTDLLPVLIVLLAVPYVFAGLTLTAFFSTHAEHSRLLYAYDLIGAGLGAIVVLPVLNLTGGINGLLVSAICLLVAGILYGAPRMLWIGALVGAVMLVSNLSANWLTVDLVDLNTDKPIQGTLEAGGELIETRQDAFARTDLVFPANAQPLRIYVDGAAASIIPPDQNNDFLMQDIGLFAFVTAQPRSVFTIGSGGGLDVWFGVRVGAESITAVEVNPQTVALVHDYDFYNGGLYDRPEVRVLVDEGRSVLRREDTNYDLIFLSQVVTLSAEVSGYALTENTVFTVEAFQDYWDHLTDEGYLAFKLYDEATLSRSLSIIIAMLNDQGMNDRDALHHTITLLDPSTSPPTPLLIARKTPFSQQEAAVIGRAAQQVGFVPLYLPDIQADPPLDVVENGTSTYAEVISQASIDISAPTDNRPFFYQFERGLPDDLQPLVVGLGVIVVLGAGLLGMIFRKSDSVRESWLWTVYFALLGMSFMLIEVTLIQSTRLFIGHPTTVITTILAGLLVSGGLGSAWYHRRAVSRLQWQPLAAVAGIVMLWLILWQVISPALIGLPTFGRVIVTLISIAPLGFAMGIPFAAGLQQIGAQKPDFLPLAWSINGVTTVAGSVLAIAIAILFGYSWVLILGAAGYALGALAVTQMQK